MILLLSTYREAMLLQMAANWSLAGPPCPMIYKASVRGKLPSIQPYKVIKAPTLVLYRA